MFAEIQQSVNYKTDCWLLTVDLKIKNRKQQVFAI